MTQEAASRTGLRYKLLAEAVGTFALVFVGCGAIMVDAGMKGLLGHGGICAAFGLVIMVMVFATGHISGAHFNPAVTIAFAAAKRFPWRSVPAYVLVQIVAATLGALTLKLVIGDVANLGMTSVNPTLSLGSAFAMEVILTAFLMFVIMAVATDSRSVGQLAGVGIGGTVALAALFGGPLTGASMNPARSLGPAFMAGVFDDQWLYCTAPILGALTGAGLYSLTRCADENTPDDAQGCC